MRRVQRLASERQSSPQQLGEPLEQILWRYPVGERGILLRSSSCAAGSFLDLGQLVGADMDTKLAALGFESATDSRHPSNCGTRRV
jgi:hypothetical protein